MAYSKVNFETGGRTPKLSQVKKIIFFGCLAIAGNLALGMCSNG